MPAYQQNLADADWQYRGIPGNKRNLIDLIKASVEMDQQIAQQNAATRQNDLASDFNERTMDSRVSQSANTAQGGMLDNEAKNLAMPENRLGAQQAGVEGNYMEQMFPGSTKTIPPPLPPTVQGMNVAPPSGMPPAVGNQFQGKSLDELRQARAAAGPTGDFVGKFIDPIIKRRSEVEEVAPAIEGLAKAAAMPGGTHEQVRAKNAAVSQVLSQFPMVAADPRVKEAATAALKASADFNPAAMMGVTQRVYGPLLSDWRSAREKYEKQYGEPFLQIEGIKNSSAYGTSLGDQSMIDKLIIMETGTKPTEAQYANLSQKIGFGDMFDIAAGKFKDGQQLSADMRKNLESEIEEQARIGHMAYSDNMGQAKEQARLMQLDPESVIRPGGSFGQVDTFMKRPHAAGHGPTKIGTKAEFDALPPGTEYIGPSGKKARKP